MYKILKQMAVPSEIKLTPPKTIVTTKQLHVLVYTCTCTYLCL